MKGSVFTLIILFVFFNSLYAQRSGSLELHFRNDDFLLNKNNTRALDSLTLLLKSNYACYIRIEGFTDRNGSAVANDILARNRAQQVGMYFAESGIPKDSINCESWGMKNFKYGTDRDSLNRRVLINYIVYQKQSAKKEVASVIKPVNEEVKELKKPDISGIIALKRIAEGKVGEKIVLPSVQFYPGSPDLLPSAFPSLDTLVSIMNNNPEMEISIEGHICCFNSDEDNLSGQRAKTVYEYLIKNSISKDRLEYKGWGHRQPLTEERTEEERQMNRRVEIRIKKR